MKPIYFLLILPFIVATATAQTGNVGLGTSSPGSKLTVNGSFAAAYTSITSTTYTAGENDFYILWNGTAAGTITLPASVSGSDRTGRLYFFKNTSAVYTMTIDADGSELIGNNPTTVIQPGEAALLVKTNDNTATGITYELAMIAKTEPAYQYAVSSAAIEFHAQGAVQTANFTTIDFSSNGGGDFNLTTDIWTCPQTGYYRIEAFESGNHPTGTTGVSHRGIYIIKNGVGAANQNQYYNLVNDLSNSGYNTAILYLVQGDQIEVRLQMCSGCGPAQIRSFLRKMVITRL